MSDTVKIEIGVDPQKSKDDASYWASVLGELMDKAEAKKNEIKVGDWFLITHSSIIRRWSSLDGGPSGASRQESKRLPDHIQKSLNEWMDSL